MWSWWISPPVGRCKLMTAVNVRTRKNPHHLHRNDFAWSAVFTDSRGPIGRSRSFLLLFGNQHAVPLLQQFWNCSHSNTCISVTWWLSRETSSEQPFHITMAISPSYVLILYFRRLIIWTRNSKIIGLLRVLPSVRTCRLVRGKSAHLLLTAACWFLA
jgi:hypothetical protein